MQKSLNIVTPLENANQFNPNDNSVYYSVEGFTNEFISDVMQEVLEYCVEND